MWGAGNFKYSSWKKGYRILSILQRIPLNNKHIPKKRNSQN